MTTRLGKETSKTMSSGKDSSEDETSVKRKWDGSPEGLEEFDKKVGRWCRKKFGTEVGNFLWENDVPDFVNMSTAEFKEYCETIWESINDRSSAMGKSLRDRDSGFKTEAWHVKWIRKQYDRIYDYVEEIVKGAASLEVETLGMKNAADVRKHLHKHFGRSGDDVRARESRYEEGLPNSAGGNPCPEGFNMEEWLRSIQAERVSLVKTCASSKRKTYEIGFETRAVKIVMKCLQGTVFQADVDSLTQEIKMKRNLEARMPKMNATTGVLELPVDVEEQDISDDWDWRNYNDDWLPSWEELKSKLISSWKMKGFNKKTGSKKAGQLPVMINPGFGTSPKVQCFGCGEHGHRRGDPNCKAPEGAWADCAPPKFKSKIDQSPNGFKRGTKRGASISGFTGKGGDGVCFAFRDTGKCKFGQNCRFKHADGPSKKVKLTKAKMKGITVAAVKSLASKIKNKAKERDGKDLDDEELNTYIASFCYVKTIPRECSEVLEIEVPAMATSDLIDMDRHACHDSGSGTGITTDPEDMVGVNDSKEAKASVTIRGPSVGKPGCLGRGALVYRKELDGIPYGVVHPDGVLADPSVGFRISSERLLGQHGLRFMGGEYNVGCKLQCVRTKVEVPMDTEENILVMETKGKASEIVDSPEFRNVVGEIRRGERSPLVDLRPFLPGGSGKQEDDEYDENKKWASTMSVRSFLFKLLMLTTTVMIFNEAKTTDVERTRLWVRKMGYCSSGLFRYMGSMPEFGDFPNLCDLNEDDLVGDLPIVNLIRVGL